MQKRIRPHSYLIVRNGTVVILSSIHMHEEIVAGLDDEINSSDIEKFTGRLVF